MHSNQTLIKSAIANKKQITFIYDNHSRTVNPHLLGTLGGELQLHAYQVSNGSASSHTRGWKNFKVDAINHLQILSSSFRAETTYHPDNANYTMIIIKV